MTAKKAELLGMPFGTAMARMRKALLYDLAGKLGLLICFQCGQPIESIDEFSIEHKEPWQAADDPASAFFSTDNLAFSHHLCNVRAARQPGKVYTDRHERGRVQYARYYERQKDAILLRKRQRYVRTK